MKDRTLYGFNMKPLTTTQNTLHGTKGFLALSNHTWYKPKSPHREIPFFAGLF